PQSRPALPSPVVATRLILHFPSRVLSPCRPAWASRRQKEQFMRLQLALVVAATIVAAAPAAAQEYAAPAGPAPETDLSLRLGLGGKVAPDYEGSDDYQLKPWPIFSLEFLRLPGIGDFGG